MANMNNTVYRIIENAFAKHALEGFWKHVQYCKTEDGTSFLLFEKIAIGKIYTKAAHLWIMKHLDPLGIFTKKRSDKAFEPLVQFLEEVPWSKEKLRVGQSVQLKALPEISSRYREGEIGSLDMLASDNIVDLVNCKEENGYMDTYGSCYADEVVLVQDENGNWHPFEDPKVEYPVLSL